MHYAFHDSVFPESDMRAIESMQAPAIHQDIANSRFSSEYNESYLRSKQRAEDLRLERQVSPQHEVAGS
jgi:hypothetical protein